MAELADALDSGSSEGNFMKVQVLLPAPVESLDTQIRVRGFFFDQIYCSCRKRHLFCSLCTRRRRLYIVRGDFSFEKHRHFSPDGIFIF